MTEYNLNTNEFSPSWPPIILFICLGLIFLSRQYSDNLFIRVSIISLSSLISFSMFVFTLKFRKLIHKAKVILNDDHISVYSYWKKRNYHIPLNLIEHVSYVKHTEIIKVKIGSAPVEYFELVMVLKNSSENYWKNWSLTQPFIIDFRKYCKENKISFEDKTG